MSCPDWRRVLAGRDRDAEPFAGERAAVLDHLSDCAACRSAALRLDPSLLWIAARPPEVADAELDEVRRGVRALRRADAVAPLPKRAPRRRLALVAAAVAAALLLAPNQLGREGELAAPGPGELVRRPAGVLVQSPSVPVLEGLGRPGARVYELSDETLSVVLVVDESLDI